MQRNSLSSVIVPLTSNNDLSLSFVPHPTTTLFNIKLNNIPYRYSAVANSLFFALIIASTGPKILTTFIIQKWETLKVYLKLIFSQNTMGQQAVLPPGNLFMQLASMLTDNRSVLLLIILLTDSCIDWYLNKIICFIFWIYLLLFSGCLLIIDFLQSVQ